ncbi:MAG: hypothetical protein MEQ07_06960 [Aquimonas sp.]|nr:hypothetical protein [Aquimonas sp.]
MHRAIKAIPAAALGCDRSAQVTELSPQAGYRHIDATLSGTVGVAMGRGPESTARQQCSWRANQRVQYRAFGRAQRMARSVRVLKAPRCDAKATAKKDVLAAGTTAGQLGTPFDGAQPGQNLTRLVGRREVIVGAQLKGENAIERIMARIDRDHWGRSKHPDAAKCVKRRICQQRKLHDNCIRALPRNTPPEVDRGLRLTNQESTRTKIRDQASLRGAIGFEDDKCS